MSPVTQRVRLECECEVVFVLLRVQMNRLLPNVPGWTRSQVRTFRAVQEALCAGKTKPCDMNLLIHRVECALYLLPGGLPLPEVRKVTGVARKRYDAAVERYWKERKAWLRPQES